MFYKFFYTRKVSVYIDFNMSKNAIKIKKLEEVQYFMGFT